MLPAGFKSSWVERLPNGRPGRGPSLDELSDFRLTHDAAKVVVRDESSWAVVRYLCQTSLRFLVQCVLRPLSPKYLPLREQVHGPIMDSYLRPIPGVSYEEWSTVKERVTLAFRGALKSTINGGFLTQVVLCDPDIRILILSGKLPHAKTILATARRPFFANEVIRTIFPESAIGTDDLTGDSFDAPNRSPGINLRDPTMGIATFDSVKAGGHYELLLFDDCTNEINCATPDLVEKNEQHFDDTYELTEPGGYRHFWGTRWAPDETDLPEVIRQRGEDYALENQGEKNTEYTAVPVWVLKDPDDPMLKAKDQKDKLSPDDVILTWPEKLNFRFLWPKYRANPQKFNLQYLLRWRNKFAADSFSEELLTSRTVPFAEGVPQPHDRFMVVNWDLGGIYSGRRNKSASDFSCGMAAMFEMSTRRCFFYDALLDVFVSSTDAASAIVQFYRRQLRIGQVGVCRIEDAFGARNLEGEIMRIAKELKLPLQIFWDLPDNTANSKDVAISVLCGVVKRGLAQFSTTLPYREEIFNQFKNWSPLLKNRKNDGPDCAAQIWKAFNAQIFPNRVPMLQPSGEEFAPEPMAVEEFDPHADERENADFALLSRMTVPHS